MEYNLSDLTQTIVFLAFDEETQIKPKFIGPDWSIIF